MADEPFLSIAVPYEADRGVSDAWDREDASEEDRDVNGDLMVDLASPYGFKRTVVITGGGPGCLAAPAADDLPTFAPIRVMNKEPFRLTFQSGETRKTLPAVPTWVACRTEAGVLVPFTMEGADIVLAGPPIVKIIGEWQQWVDMRLIRFRWSRDRDAATVSWTIEAKQ